MSVLQILVLLIRGIVAGRADRTESSFCQGQLGRRMPVCRSGSGLAAPVTAEKRAEGSDSRPSRLFFLRTRLRLHTIVVQLSDTETCL
jgi:hypothetical protein